MDDVESLVRTPLPRHTDFGTLLARWQDVARRFRERSREGRRRKGRGMGRGKMEKEKEKEKVFGLGKKGGGLEGKVRWCFLLCLWDCLFVCLLYCRGAQLSIHYRGDLGEELEIDCNFIFTGFALSNGAALSFVAPIPEQSPPLLLLPILLLLPPCPCQCSSPSPWSPFPSPPASSPHSAFATPAPTSLSRVCASNSPSSHLITPNVC